MSRTGNLFLIGMLAMAAGRASALPPLIEGRVFDDRNGNRVQDVNESGIAGVAVSDGRTIGRTDAKGRWQLAPSDSPILYVIKPDAWQVPTASSGLPDFWVDRRQAADDHDIAFALHRPKTRHTKNADGKLDLLVFGDPQPKNDFDVGYYEKDIVEPLLGKTEAGLGISLGDIVHGNLALYPAMNNATRRLGMPWLHVSGNHDRDHSAPADEASLETFSRYYGPDTFAWEQSGVSVVVLDDVIHKPGTGSPALYVGGLRDSQFRFLENYLGGLPKNRRLVIAMHIPLFNADNTPGRDTFRDADRQRLFSLLRDFDNVLLLSAHTHMQRHFFHGAREGWKGKTPLHEYNVGAACGAYWSGVKDADGIPDALMQDGTPNGHARLSWPESGKPRLDWQVARAPIDMQMHLFAPKALRKGAYPGFGVYANIFMGMNDTPVEYRIDEGEWKPMTRVETLDPWVVRINIADAGAEQLRSYDLMSEAAVSQHLWRGPLATHLALGAHRVEVRANLNGQWFADSLSYQLQQSEP